MSLDEIPYRPSIFVASSSASRTVAEAVKEYFAGEADVDVWADEVFKLNESTMQTLLNRASYNDFFIAIFAADDEAVIKGEKKKIPRGNVVFEFGLFLGRIGMSRTFFILEEGTDLFSDWDGLSITRFNPGGDLKDALAVSCQRIREKMRDAERQYDFTVLPSTSLAIGYYNNFLKPVLYALDTEKTFEIVQKDRNGEVMTRFTQAIEDHTPTIEIRTPRDLSVLDRDVLKERTRGYTQIILTTKVRPFPFYVQGSFGENDTLHLFDIPTTLLASYCTIREFFSNAFLAQEGTLQRLMDREVRNFEMVLSKLMPNRMERMYYVFTVY